jgi:hypothetical protein
MSASLTFWLLPVFAVLHVCEEFFIPGGFADWYRTYRPAFAPSMTSSYFLRVNTIYVGACFLAAILTSQGNHALWLTMSTIQVSNAIFHAIGTFRTRKYTPGLITGLVLYGPLFIFGTRMILAAQFLSSVEALKWAGLGFCYQAYSYWNHARRSGQVAARPH